MQLKHDVDNFDKLQEVLVSEIIEQIRFKLINAGISGDKLRDITGEIAFSVASTIDDTAGIEVDGLNVKPYLTFASEEDQLIHCGENSCMHEFVSTIIGKVFSEQTNN